MASNINKAFMRAYAKDRSATADSAPVANSPPAPAAPTPVAPAAAAQPTQPSAVTPTEPAPSRIQPAVQPSMEPTVFAGRYTPPKVIAPPPSKPKPIATPTPTPASTLSHATPAAQVNTHRIPAPGISNPSQPTAAQPRVVASTQRPAARPPSTRIERVQENDTGEASKVWQRIDEAHDSQAVHPINPQARPTVSVNAARTAAPKRMQAAAPTPAPAAPAPQLSVDAAPANTRHLPLVGDQPNDQPQQAEARRRTVADFLYSAGQYNPGRVLASAEHVDAALAAHAASSTAMPTASMRTADMNRPMERSSEPSVGGEAMLDSHSTAGQQANFTHAFDAVSSEEGSPRRTGQILRVDIPSNHVQSATNSSVMSNAAMSNAAMANAGMANATKVNAGVSNSMMASATAAQSSTAASMPTRATAHSAMQPAMQATMQSTMQSSMSTVAQPPVARPPMPSAPSTASPMPPASSIDAPVAKYVLEQRRVDRAHKLNEAEEKLRHSTHKIFNPVWEVDNLQWPAVVDKLMQQRAQSMSHVAEHLKTACQDGLSVLGVTSAGQGEGRTTVACCLARLAAAHGLNVALVDIDLDHPTLCVQTNMEVELDWRDCLSEDVTLEEVAVHSIDDQLTVLPLKPRGGRPGLLASDARIADILTDLSECFELVIVDCAKTSSSGNVISGLAHTKIFDAAILVVDRRDGEADRIEDAVRMIQQTGIESIGIVDNFSM